MEILTALAIITVLGFYILSGTRQWDQKTGTNQVPVKRLKSVIVNHQKERKLQSVQERNTRKRKNYLYLHYINNIYNTYIYYTTYFERCKWKIRKMWKKVKKPITVIRFVTIIMNFEQIRQTLKNSDERCAICYRPFRDYPGYVNETKQRRFQDHNHKTGQVRSFLCPRCNTMVGFFEKNSQLINPVLDYISYWDNQSNLGEWNESIN